MLKSLSLAGYLLMMVGSLGLVINHALFSRAPLVIVLQVLAFAIFLWARITFGKRSFHLAANPTEGGLVTTGPYRHIRHPIYTAFCLFTWAGLAAHWSWKAALFGALILGGSVLRIFCEETLVVARYPEYKKYALGTWRMIPYLF